MSSTLYLKDKYLDTDVDFLVGYEIIEYDMKSAGMNISKEYNLLSEKEIKDLEDLPKMQRSIRLGLLQKSRPIFKENLKEGFKKARALLFDNNNLEDKDILAIKKDAIFTLRRCKNTSFGNIKFMGKNIYTSYYRINRVEFFYNSTTDVLDIKNIGDDRLELHNEGMIAFFKEFFRLKERGSDKQTIQFLKEFMCEYKTMDLPIEFYREFNQNSMYKMYEIMNGKSVYLEDLEVDHYEIDIKYNYVNFILPLVRMMI